MDKETKSAIYIKPDGSIFHVYDDDLAPVVKDLCKEKARRASHVELFVDLRHENQNYIEHVIDPDAGTKNEWWVDLTPSRGAIFGPFKRRDEAIEFEIEWLIKNKGEGYVAD